MDEGLKQTIERVKRQNAHVLPITNMVQHVPSDIQRLIVAAERTEAAEAQVTKLTTMLAGQERLAQENTKEFDKVQSSAQHGVMVAAILYQQWQDADQWAKAAEARVKELEAQIAGMLPAAQSLVTSIEFLPLAMANPLAEMTKRAEARPVTWIPVAERLPATMLRVLAVYVKGGVTITIRALHIAAHEAICWGFDFDEAIYDAEEDKYYYPEGWYEAMEDGEFAFIGPVEGEVTHWAQLPILP